MVEEIRSVTTTQESVIEGQREAGPAERERSFRTVPRLNKSPLHGLWALTNRDLKKWYKNPIQLFISLIQPVVWLALFGKALNFGTFLSQSGGSQAQQSVIMQQTFGTSSYFSFLSVGMLAFIILFTAAFSGMSVVFDRRFGFLNKALSTPVGRASVVTSKVLQSVIRSLIQAVIVLI
ncbi:MAG: ABC transporter permease, partial [Nitrososphaerales archaeon]